MSEPCPSCGGELSFVAVRTEAKNHNSPRFGFYEYQHLPADGRCSLVVQPGINFIRCLQCTKWVPGQRSSLGPVICLECIAKGYDYEDFDFKSGLDGPERIQ